MIKQFNKKKPSAESLVVMVIPAFSREQKKGVEQQLHL